MILKSNFERFVHQIFNGRNWSNFTPWNTRLDIMLALWYLIETKLFTLKNQLPTLQIFENTQYYDPFKVPFQFSFCSAFAWVSMIHPGLILNQGSSMTSNWDFSSLSFITSWQCSSASRGTTTKSRTIWWDLTQVKKKNLSIRILREINYGGIGTLCLGEEETLVVPKSLESFLSNCVIMGIMFVGIFTFGAYRR